jgi:hypothetical protein
MMDFIMAPTIIGIIIYGLYSIFELYARRKERITLIEKLGAGSLQGEIKWSGKIESSNKFSALKWGGLLLGIGAGLLVGFIFANDYVPYNNFITTDDYDMLRRQENLLGVIYGSASLLGGGLGLLTAFLIEFRLSRKKNA